jgi:three-Cys-motif partner protein
MSAKRSPYSTIKQECLTDILRPWFTVMRALTHRGWYERVYVADLNAGPGLYPDGMRGSPLIIEGLLHELAVPHDTYFFEQYPKTADRLNRALLKAGYCGHILRGDHHDTIAHHLQTLAPIGLSRLGIIYIDGNGERMPVSVIKAILRHPRYDRVDVLLNQPTRAYKRRRGAGLDRASFREDLLALGKARLQFRDFGTNQSWVFALATNWRGVFPFPHFHDLTSKKGQWILQRLDQTLAERRINIQPELPHLWPIAITGNTSPTHDTAPSGLKPLPELADGANAAPNVG